MLTIQILGTGMLIRRFSAIVFTLFFNVSVFAAASDEFTALMDEAWQAELANSPLYATYLGDRRYNDRWEDLSISAIETQQQQTRDFLRRAYAIDKNALGKDQQLNYELFRRTLQDQVDAFQFNEHLMPLHHRGGVQNLENNINYLSFESVKDYDDWLARMSKIGE